MKHLHDTPHPGKWLNVLQELWLLFLSAYFAYAKQNFLYSQSFLFIAQHLLALNSRSWPEFITCTSCEYNMFIMWVTLHIMWVSQAQHVYDSRLSCWYYMHNIPCYRYLHQLVRTLQVVALPGIWIYCRNCLLPVKGNKGGRYSVNIQDNALTFVCRVVKLQHWSG